MPAVAVSRPLEGRVALVTGGSRGIGRGIVLALAAAGANVVVNYSRDRAAAEAVLAEAKALGRQALACQADVADASQVEGMVAKALSRMGRVDILVHSAGINSRGRFVIDTDPQEVQRLMAVHALGAFILCHALLPHLRQLSRADIIFISSTGAQDAIPGGAPYTMAKAALEALARTLAKEERVHNIRVNVIAPGFAETEMGRRVARARGCIDIRDLYPRFPFGRICRPEDIGNLCVFLASSLGEYISGQVIRVDGGEAVMP